MCMQFECYPLPSFRLGSSWLTIMCHYYMVQKQVVQEGVGVLGVYWQYRDLFYYIYEYLLRVCIIR
jgi:hypothetical protein